MISFAAAERRRLFLVYGVVALALLVYWPSLTALHVIWTDVESRGYTHGYLIAALCVFLLARVAPDLARCTFSPAIAGLVALPIASALWLIAWNAGLREPYVMLLPVLAWLAVLASAGFKAARIVAFPIGFLYFAIPFWGHINGVLQAMTTKVTVFMLKIVGVQTSAEGNIIHIPAGAFEVAGGCSGLHYFVVGLSVATLVGELERHTLRRRAVLIGLMAALSIVTNWARVFTVVLSGQLTNMESYLVRVDHYWFGWVLFGAVMMGFIWFTGGRARPAASDGASSSLVQPLPPARPAVFAAVLLVALPITQWIVRFAQAPTDVAHELPAGKAGWTGPYSAAQDWRPVFHGVTSEVLAAYRDRDARAVEVYNAVYVTQRQGAELIGYGNSLVGERGLRWRAETVVATVGGPVIETVVADRLGRESIIWSVYDVGGRTFVEPLRSQLWYGVRSFGSHPVASLSAARAVCVPDCNGAREKLGRFFEQMWPRLRDTATAHEG